MLFQSLPPGTSFKIESENPVALAARLNKEACGAKDARLRKQTIFIVCLILFVLTFVVTGCLSFTDHHIDTGPWVRTMFTNLITAVVAYIVGKNSKCE